MSEGTLKSRAEAFLGSALDKITVETRGSQRPTWGSAVLTTLAAMVIGKVVVSAAVVIWEANTQPQPTPPSQPARVQIEGAHQTATDLLRATEAGASRTGLPARETPGPLGAEEAPGQPRKPRPGP